MSKIESNEYGRMLKRGESYSLMAETNIGQTQISQTQVNQTQNMTEKYYVISENNVFLFFCSIPNTSILLGLSILGSYLPVYSFKILTLN